MPGESHNFPRLLPAPILVNLFAEPAIHIVSQVERNLALNVASFIREAVTCRRTCCHTIGLVVIITCEQQLNKTAVIHKVTHHNYPRLYNAHNVLGISKTRSVPILPVTKLFPEVIDLQ